MNYTIEEKKLTLYLRELLANDFHITTESELKTNPGIFSLDGQTHKLIPDLLLRPKEHLLTNVQFIDTVIPVEVKHFSVPDCNKFEDLMCQCHSYRFSSFSGIYPKLCLYYLGNYFDQISYDYEASKDPKLPEYNIRKNMQEKKKLETFMGRFGIGEIINIENTYTFRLKRQVLFHKLDMQCTFKPEILNFSLGTSGNKKMYSQKK